MRLKKHRSAIQQYCQHGSWRARAVSRRASTANQADNQSDLLSTLDEKLLLLSKTHVDNTVVLHFDASMAALTAHAFMRDVLQGQLKVRKLIIGYDNRFGHNRSEGFDDYVRYGKELGIEVIRADAFLPDDVRVSSSVIRTSLLNPTLSKASPYD